MIQSVCRHLGRLPWVEAASVVDNAIRLTVQRARRYALSLELGKSFPYALPKIFLQDPASHGYRAHVCWRGEICVSDQIGTSIDISRPLDVAERYVADAVDILEAPANLDEFFQEFEGYWNNQTETRIAYVVGTPSAEMEELRCRVDRHGVSKVFQPEHFDQTTCGGLLRSTAWSDAQQVAFHVPLIGNIAVPTPRKPLCIGDVDSLIAQMSSGNRDRLLYEANALQRKGRQRNLNLLLSQSRPAGGRSLFGIWVEHGVAYLTGRVREYRGTIRPLQVQRLSAEYLLPRACAAFPLFGKRVGIIGAGAVGGYVAELLIQAGILDLTLIDDDVYSADNIFRHALPCEYVGRTKVAALCAFLSSRFPFVRMTPVTARLPHIDAALLEALDCLVVAIGDPTIERDVNSRMPTPIVVTTWLEPMGLGGHAILSDQTPGCLDCLYHNANMPSLFSQVSFVEKDQAVGRNLTGCQGAFVPFGSIDAMQTAILAARLVTARLLGPLRAPDKYLYWRGSDAMAQAEGIATTGWYRDCIDPRFGADCRTLLARGCPTCGNRGM